MIPSYSSATTWSSFNDMRTSVLIEELTLSTRRMSRISLEGNFHEIITENPEAENALRVNIMINQKPVSLFIS